MRIDSSVLNAGTITVIRTLGGISNGILSLGVAPSIVNTGTISVTGDGGNGISSGGDFFSILNSGTISVTGGLAYGVLLETSGTLVNSGTISGTGEASLGVLVDGASNTLLNSGTISATGQNSRGVLLRNASSTLVNSGTISVTGTNSIAVGSNVFGNSAVVVNSGTIKGPTALDFQGVNPTLSLLLGSNIQGVVNTVEALNLNVQEGLNLRLTIEEENGFGRLNIGSPYITVGNTETIAVVDRTGFTMQADVLEDLSDSVLDSIYRGKYDYLHCCDLHCGG